MEIHTIATPIAGMVTVNQLCGYNPPEKINKNVKVNQWITQKNIDNAFKELDVDPQIISLEKTSLPKKILITGSLYLVGSFLEKNK